MSELSINDDGLLIPKQDLSTLDPSQEDEGRLFNHDGSSSITLTDGSTTTSKGYYLWDNAAGQWNPMKNTITDADQLDGFDSTDFTLQTDFDSHAGDTAAHHPEYTDADAQAAINNDTDHGSTAPHNYYTDSEAQTAVEGSVNVADLVSGSASNGDVPEADGAGGITWSTSGGFNGIADNLSVTDWQVIDVGNEGFPGDRTGGDLAQYVADNTSAGSKTVFILPEGTYDWNRSVQFIGDSGGTFDEDRPHTIMLIGKPKATLHVDIGSSVDQTDRKLFQFGSSSSGIERVSLQNLHIDVGSANESRDAGLARTYIEDWGYFKNITMSRRHRCDSTDPSSKNGDRFSLKVDCINRDATARMERIKFANGDVHVSDDDSVGHAIPFSSEDPHVGTNHWIDCYVEDFTDNGYYVRDGHGTNYLKGCTTKDCCAGSFRLGLNDRAENITSIVENPAYNCTPLWVEVKRESVDNDGNYVEGDEKSEPTVVDGFDIHTSSGAAVNDVIRVSSNLPEATIKNGFVHSETDDFLIDASAYTGSLTVENVQFDDYATGNFRKAAIRLRMDNVTLDGCTYRPYPPDGENGRSIIQVENANITIKDCDLKGTYLPAIETYASADFQLRGNKFGHDGSYTDPYFIRNNKTSADALWIVDNDLRPYASLFGSDSSSSDYSYFEKRGNRGP